MGTSSNGWPASPNLKTRVIEPVKGVRLRIVDNQNVADIFTYLIQQYHRRVDDVTKPHKMDDWGFHYRPNKNNPSKLSNHASGTAIDLDATEHPNKVPTLRTFTTKQVNEVHRILKELGGVVQWGGDYTHTPDAMHFEINVRPGGLRAVGKKIRTKSKPLPPVIKVPKGLVKTPSAWSRFAHLQPYALNNSYSGLVKARLMGYEAIDLDGQVTKDNVIIITHWHDTREFEKKRRLWKDLTWDEVKNFKSLKGGYPLRTAGQMIHKAKAVGLKRIEFDAKGGGGKFQGDVGRRLFSRLGAHAQKAGIQLQVKSLTSIAGTKERLLAAKKAGRTTIVLPRGKARLTVVKDYAGVADYYR